MAENGKDKLGILTQGINAQLVVSLFTSDTQEVSVF